MGDSKQYYYLKLKDNYFNRESVKILESLENGYIYSNILLKLTLISLKHEGRLRFKATLPYNEKMLATITGHDIDNIRSALKIFTELELIEKLEDGTIYMLELQELIGESSTEADRLKKYRKKIKEEKQQQITDQCTNVQEPYINQTPELELKLESEIELESEIDKGKKNMPSASIEKELYHTFEDIFLSQIEHEVDYNYGKEGVHINGLVEKAMARASPFDFAKDFVNTFWELKKQGNDFWKGQPLLPSIANSKGIYPRILEAMKKHNKKHSLSEEQIKVIDSIKF